MSLVGSLEDLGIADLLQFLGLSRKSGVLVVRSERGEGRIVFRDGLVCGAGLLGDASDLRSLLVGGGLVRAAAFEAAQVEGERRRTTVAEVLATTEVFTREALDALLRQRIESAVRILFGWRVGEFEFDVRAKPDPGDIELLLTEGISAPYLAMEGARLIDEAQRVPPQGGESTREEGHPPPVAGAPPPPSIVVIDADLSMLEWVKRSLSGVAGRIHIFQRSELALERIRQYLMRSEPLVVLLSPGVAGDPLSGIRDATDFVRRIKNQSPLTRVLWLRAEGEVLPDSRDPADGLAPRPEPAQLDDPGAIPRLELLAEKLRSAALGCRT